MAYVIGVDVGGTNTDTAILCGRQVVAKGKTPTTEDRTQGVVNSIQTALDSLTENTRQHVLNDLARVSIGTTHFTNAVQKRDASSLDRVAVIRLCGSASRALPPFADFPDDLKQLVFGGRFMLSGGVEYNARVIEAIDAEEVKRCVREIVNQTPSVRNVVISGVFSPCDEPSGRQEKEVEEILKVECPEMSYTLSHEFCLLGLLERENAAILNEALKRLAKMTITAFKKALSDLRVHCECPFFLTQNDGTMISADEAMQYPVLTFSSGPTNSMRGAAFLSGLANAIVVDIGGTTTDVGVLKKGFPQEASAHCIIGGVRTNFNMPDVQSIALGGGTLVEWNSATECVRIGPDSVEYRIKQEALCFGGSKLTATDIAIAAGVAPRGICRTPEAVSTLSAHMVYSTMRKIRKMIELVIDKMKIDKGDVPVILVGGGSVLVDCHDPLKGVSRVILPADHWDVANAVGAALGTVGGASDLVVNLGPIKEKLRESREKAGLSPYEGDKLERRAREVALERGRESARAEVILKKHADPSTVYIQSEDISNIQYVEGRVRVKVKAIGALSVQDAPIASPDNGQSHSSSENRNRNHLDVSQIIPVQDNPFWPHSSAEDRAKDEAANLPPPRVVDCGNGHGSAEWLLSVHDVECLAIGAGILGCGGGGDPHDGKLRAIQMLKNGKEMRVQNPSRLNSSKLGLVCGVGFMGAPVIQEEKLIGGEETMLAFTRLQQVLGSGVCEGGGKESNNQVKVEEKTCNYPDGTSFPVHLASNDDLKKIDMDTVPLNRKITALICLEAGGCNSIEPLLVGAQTELPILDVDGMGRAFPELQMFLPFIYGSSCCPSSLADNKGEVMTCTNVASPNELEKFFRVETVRMGMSAGLAIGVLDYKEVLSKTVMFALSRAWQLGRAVMRARKSHSNVIQAIVTQQNGMGLIRGKVISVSKDVSAGFTKVVSVIEGLEEYAGHHVRILAKNENYVVQRMDITTSKEQKAEEDEGEMLACTPDLISIVDSDTGIPVTTQEVRYGLRVGVVILPPCPLFKTPQALKVVGPRAFGFAVDYKEPKPLLPES